MLGPREPDPGRFPVPRHRARPADFARYNAEALRIFGLQAVRCEFCGATYMPQDVDGFLRHIRGCNAEVAAEARRRREEAEAAERERTEREREAAERAEAGAAAAAEAAEAEALSRFSADLEAARAELGAEVDRARAERDAALAAAAEELAR